MKKLDEERIHMEKIINNRVHFLILILTLIIAGAINANSILQARILFIFGFFLSLLLSLTLARAQKRFDVLLNKIHENPNHAATYAKNKADKSCFPTNFSVRKIIGYFIPIAIVALMLLFSLRPDLLYYEKNEKGNIYELKAQIDSLNKRLANTENALENIKNNNKDKKISNRQTIIMKK